MCEIVPFFNVYMIVIVVLVLSRVDVIVWRRCPGE